MKRLFRWGGLLSLFLLCLGEFSPAIAQTRLVMKIENPAVAGESKLVGHLNWIDVVSYGQEVQHLLGAQPDTGYFSIVKALDRASVDLAFHAVQGTVFGKLTLEVLSRIGQNYLPELRVELADARVVMTRPELGVSASQEGVIFDGYTQITWTYYRRRGDGSLIGTVTRTVPGS